MVSMYSHRVISDIFNLEHVVQQVGMVATKNILIDTLRDIFRQDREYKYVQDVFGFPKTPNHLGLAPDAGLNDEETTRIFIGSTYRYDVKFNPSIIVKNTGSTYNPISFNQDFLGVVYKRESLSDGYGNRTTVSTPAFNVLVGAWEQTYEIKVIAESEVDREEITDIVMVSLIGSRRRELEQAGVFIKTIRSGGETEEPYANDYLYTVSINIDVRTEWKIHIPINDVCERIALCLTFNALDSDPPANGLDVNEQLTQADELS
jgi:hypothetical protein